jgi:hypothetical protein
MTKNNSRSQPILSEHVPPAVRAGAPLRQLLFSREQVAQMLGGISIATVRRLEHEGRLKPVRLSRSPTAMVFFRASDVDALIDEAADG